ncbi:MAG: hypothetical protein ISR50_18250 [Alphaproteobacteria bacterium]|nr:hypothetical protein [Alphaproteobacteria bacterium]
MSDLPASVIFHEHGPREGFQIESRQQRCKSPASTQRFLNVHASADNSFYVQRSLLGRLTFKQFRTDAFNAWEDATAIA